MNLKREIPLIIIVLIPFIYLAYIWSLLPETVPTHWNYKGEIDDWGSKNSLILITFLLSGVTYILFTIIPLIDPKKRIQTMGNKYHNLKFLMVLFMSALAVFIIYSVKEQSITNPSLVIFAIGILFMLLGNYMKTIKANYFIGIRTPWTLENESVWKSTHKLAGKLWFVGGLAIAISSLTASKKFNSIFFISVTLLITLIPFVYSYLEYKKIRK
ncbi:SdpI family protein [uncultured Algibacter sp.]|uniref:SdpI family protein n=1 Tax=uncultured Algibacter sp. TaxID=298659 RepID=UPI0026286FCD|nr:SdpI family protein [uncultured Algibacter sp.]